jgi:TonB family protein
LALAYSVQGGSIIRLDIGADGRVRGCKSLNAAQYRGFEYSTCDLIKGARFEPALDASGKPVTAPYIFYIRFTIL